MELVHTCTDYYTDIECMRLCCIFGIKTANLSIDDIRYTLGNFFSDIIYKKNVPLSQIYSTVNPTHKPLEIFSDNYKVQISNGKKNGIEESSKETFLSIYKNITYWNNDNKIKFESNHYKYNGIICSKLVERYLNNIKHGIETTIYYLPKERIVNIYYLNNKDICKEEYDKYCNNYKNNIKDRLDMFFIKELVYIITDYYFNYEDGY